MRKAVATALAGVLLAGLPTAYAAAQAPAARVLPITIAEQPVGDFAVDGDQVLYSVEDGRRLLLHNLADGTTRTLATDGPFPFLQLEGDRAAYGAFPNNGGMWLMLHDLKSGNRTQVERRPMGFAGFASDLMVWAKGGTLPPLHGEADGTTRDHPVTLYNLATNTRTEVAREIDSLLYGHPIIFDGRFLVWTEVQGDVREDATITSTLVAVDVTSGRRHEQRLAGPARTGSIDAGKVLYATWSRPGSTRLNLWEPATGETEALELTGPLSAHHHSWDLQGDRIAWLTQSPDSAGDLYTMDLTTRTPQRLTTDGTPKYGVLLGARHAVYRTPQGLHAVPLTPAEQTPDTATAPRFHTVQPGETAWKVAQYRTSLDWLSSLNSLTMESMRQMAPGRQLTIARGPLPHVAGGQAYQTYALMPGDTLWQVSLKSGVPIAKLLAQNPNASSRASSSLEVGERLIIRPW